MWANNFPAPSKADITSWNTLKGSKNQKSGTVARVGLFGYDIQSLLADCYTAPAIPKGQCDLWKVFDGWTIGAALSIDATNFNTNNNYGVCFPYFNSCSMIYTKVGLAASTTPSKNFAYASIQYPGTSVTTTKPGFIQSTTISHFNWGWGPGFEPSYYGASPQGLFSGWYPSATATW